MTASRDPAEPAGPPDLQRLRRLLGGEDLAWLVARVRGRMERGDALDATLTRSGATEAERAAVARLLGRRPRPGAAVSVPLPAVDAVLRRSGACPGGLAAAVVALTGPVTDRGLLAQARERAWREAFVPLAAAVAGRPELHQWYEEIRARGLVRRLAGTAERAAPLLAQLAAVLEQLPAQGEPLGHFAARVTGSAHALDADRPLATLALGAARALTGEAEGSGAQWRRTVWASVGLLRDDLSSTVLTLGLAGDDRSATGRALAAWQRAGQPVVLTLRQLVRDAPLLRPELVSVCENPVVVAAAAEELGAACRPLVCTAGQPGAATMRLLRQLCEAGAELRYHGDFDWGGVRIGNTVFDRLPARPWRFDAAAYRGAPAGRPLAGEPVAARWDPELAPALRERGEAVEEELLLEPLLADLRR